MAIAKAIRLALVGLMLAGCENLVASSGVYYNVGIAEASNSLLLANIIRSAKGYPTYYSLIGDYSGSTSASLSPSVDLSVPLPAQGQSKTLDLGLTGSISTDRNANVSSLETQDFTRAMHTLVPPNLLLFLIESRDDAHVHLILALIVKSNRLLLKDYEEIVQNARDECERRFETLSSAKKGVCRNFEAVRKELTCDFVREPSARGDVIVTIRNHPANRCAFSQFRMFSEAVMLNRGRVFVDKKGNLNVEFGRTASERRNLFDAEGTSITLRSPSGVIHYLGEIVREQYNEDNAWTPTLTTRAGRSVPIFRVESGLLGVFANISAEVDGEEYWIRSQELGEREEDFSHRALTIVKDFQALNTKQDQLPSSPAIILGPGSSLTR
ncbi:MAG: hypothetical protein MJE12_18460 [Alphaproteobacteria bacterium]|nr:hypothetical protein [Alphaproteobacteria bacterium]